MARVRQPACQDMNICRIMRTANCIEENREDTFLAPGIIVGTRICFRDIRESSVSMCCNKMVVGWESSVMESFFHQKCFCY